MGRVSGKTFVITGASSGMGRAVVGTFVREGANVVAVARRKERLDELAESLKDTEGTITVFPGDVTKNEVNEQMIDEAVRVYGKLDGLVNVAGVMDDMAPIAEITDERYEKVMAVNLYGPMCAMRKAVKIFLKQGDGGSIVNVASIGAMRTVAGPIYGASKAALIAMSKNTAFMYIPQKIRCNVIAPGGFKTEIQNSMGQPNRNGYDRVKQVMASAPELGEPQYIADAALFLSSSEASYISGDVLVVDGGWMAG